MKEYIDTKETKKFDVVVLGGGVAGVSAALSAARLGNKVALIEKNCNLGGLATSGLVIVYLPLCDGNGKQVSFGIVEELLYESIKYGPGDIPKEWKNSHATVEDRKNTRFKCRFNPASFALALHELVKKESIEVFYDTRAVNVKMEGEKAIHLVVENKSGRLAIPFNVAVDASGDADLMYWCKEKTESLNDNRKTGWYFSYENQKPIVHMLNEDLLQPISNNSRGYRGDDGKDVSDFISNAHDMILDDILNKGWNFKEDYPLLIPSIPQFRMTRRLVGEYSLSEKDEWTYFDDCVGVCPNWRKSNSVYYLPFRTLYGKVSNVLCAGRCISSEGVAWDTTRAIQCCAVSGQAAGTAASLYAKLKLNHIKELPVDLLQDSLQKQGVIL